MAVTGSDLHQRAEEAIFDLIADLGPDKTICPSEAARALAGEKDFRPYMDRSARSRPGWRRRARSR
jgi:hypothetical protein